MNQLRLRYERDDAPNASGFLHTEVDADGFAGANRTYVAERWLAEFANALSRYPIPEAGVALEDAQDLTIVVTPFNSRGQLLVSVRLHGHDDIVASQTATLQIISDYAAIDTFRRDLLAICNGSISEATLRSHY